MFPNNNSPFAGLSKVFFVLLVIGALAAFALSNSDLVSPITNFTHLYTPAPIPTSNVLAVQNELIKLQNDVTSLQKKVDTLSQVPTDTAIYSELTQMHSKLDSIDGRLQALEKTILDNPSKALEVTLLHSDVETLKQTRTSDLQTIQEAIGRMYDLTKWIVGLMFTMALGLLGLAVGNLFSKPVKQDEKKAPKKTKETD